MFIFQNLCKIYLKKGNSLINFSGFHTSCFLNGTRQVEKTMKKVLGINSKRKKMFYNEAINTASEFSKATSGNNSIHPRRATVLNKLFMRNITDLMSTGEYASQILGLGIEVNKVKITYDYKILKVYWITKSSKVEEAEEVLNKNAGLLRHELSTLKVMGHVPIIQFVKDKNYAYLVELDSKLSLADYGEEGPSNIDPAAHLISEFELSLPIETNLKTEIAKLEKQNPCEIEELQLAELPPMTNGVFDLDHEAIMNKIKTASSKTRYTKTADDNWANFKLKQYSNVDPVLLSNAKSQREAFNKFLQQRQVLKMKEKRRNNNDRNIVFAQEELEVDWKNYYENKDDDFILEDIDETK